VSLTLWNLSVPAAEHGDGAGEFVNRKAFFTEKKKEGSFIGIPTLISCNRRNQSWIPILPPLRETDKFSTTIHEYQTLKLPN
jgi:hypothetical protein